MLAEDICGVNIHVCLFKFPFGQGEKTLVFLGGRTDLVGWGVYVIFA
jgi:hypothetical protein